MVKLRWNKQSPMYADLHTHTVASDGTFTASQLAQAAQTAMITLLAVADHDTTASVKPLIEAATPLGIRVLPAVELSCDGAPGDCHMLGLKIDIDNPYFKTTLETLSENRRTRNAHMVERLNANGINITMDDVLSAAPMGVSLGRPHIALAMVARGYSPDLPTAFSEWLGDGKRAYIAKATVTPQQGIELIHRAGGLAFLAHPGLLTLKEHETYETRFRRLKEQGLDGIEAYYSSYTPAQTDYFLRMADKLGLLVCGGSDFHGANKPDVPLGIVIDGKPLPIELLPKELSGI